MPATFVDHASQTLPVPANQRRDMEKRSKDIVLCPTDDDTVTSKRPSLPQKDKLSLDYAWRSGLAGGLAGCAVYTNCL